MLLTGGNHNDVTQLIPLLQAIRRSAATRPGLRKVDADRGYDHDKYRVMVRELGIHRSPAAAPDTAPGWQGAKTSFALLHWIRHVADPEGTAWREESGGAGGVAGLFGRGAAPARLHPGGGPAAPERRAGFIGRRDRGRSRPHDRLRAGSGLGASCRDCGQRSE
ncbi:transposase [Actinoplanes sp. NPDC051343]|uniref:transposase n=1 Tax=Actinoplanes sp. NPDC051343 TaxID=3363906 RepID=UPI00379C97C9